MPELIEFPPHPEPGETRLDWEARALRPWRMEMKAKLLIRRGPMCERNCGRHSCDLDEGVVPRSAMRGLPLEKRRIAFGSCGLFLLCAECNRNEAHQTEWAFEAACRRYGEDAVRCWYASVGFRAPEWRFMPRAERAEDGTP